MCGKVTMAVINVSMSSVFFTKS